MVKVEDDLPGLGLPVENIRQRTFNFNFTNRNRRPPTDPVNAMLSLGYSMLAKDCTLAALAVGFDPYLGFYHQPRFGPAGVGVGPHGRIQAADCRIHRVELHQQSSHYGQGFREGWPGGKPRAARKKTILPNLRTTHEFTYHSSTVRLQSQLPPGAGIAGATVGENADRRNRGIYSVDDKVKYANDLLSLLRHHR